MGKEKNTGANQHFLPSPLYFQNLSKGCLNARLLCLGLKLNDRPYQIKGYFFIVDIYSTQIPI